MNPLKQINVHNLAHDAASGSNLMGWFMLGFYRKIWPTETMVLPIYKILLVLWLHRTGDMQFDKVASKKKEE